MESVVKTVLMAHVRGRKTGNSKHVFRQMMKYFHGNKGNHRTKQKFFPHLYMNMNIVLVICLNVSVSKCVTNQKTRKLMSTSFVS